MKFYHVSTHCKTGDILARKSKPFCEYCEVISKCDLSTYDSAKEMLEWLRANEVYKHTQRTEEKWLCEALFEKERRDCFQEKPSRIWGTFLSKSIEDAQCFRKGFRKPESKIFEIVIPCESKIYSFNMDLFSKAEQTLENFGITENTYVDVINLAREYWKGCIVGQTTNVEWLYEGTVEIGLQVKLPPSLP